MAEFWEVYKSGTGSEPVRLKFQGKMEPVRGTVQPLIKIMHKMSADLVHHGPIWK